MTLLLTATPLSRHLQVASAVIDDTAPELDDPARDEVLRFVRTQLRRLPPHLRLGVDGLGVVLAVTGTSRALARLGASRIPMAQQYLRLIRSLVLFAVFEKTA